MTLTVSALADRVGLSPDAIRYYERCGLLPPPARSAAGWRLYDEHAVERLRFVKGAQRVGLRLREIRELLEVVDQGQCPCGHTDALLRQLLADTPKGVRPTSTAQQWWCVQAFSSEGGDGDGGVPELRLPVR
jgi:DNA-binding transcriptional MerR regulator